MSDTNRLFFLRIALVAICLTFIFGIYTLGILWPSGWVWGQGPSHYLMMIIGVYGVIEVIRFKDAVPNEKGLLVYSALYILTQENLHQTAEWKAVSDLGRWAPVIRPKVKSRARRAGPVVARFRNEAR